MRMIEKVWLDNYTISGYQRERALNALEFWRKMMVGNFLLMFGGIVLLMFLFGQLISADVGVGRIDLPTLVIGVVVSGISFRFLKQFIKVQKDYVSAEADVDESLEIDSRFTLDILLAISIGGLAFGAFWQMSEILGETTIPDAYSNVRSGNGTWIDLTANILFQLTYVGAVATTVASLMFTRYQLFPLTHRARIQLSRIWVGLFHYIMSSMGRTEFNEKIESRCSSCWKDNYTLRDGAEKELICTYCGTVCWEKAEVTNSSNGVDDEIESEENDVILRKE